MFMILADSFAVAARTDGFTRIPATGDGAWSQSRAARAVGHLRRPALLSVLLLGIWL